MRHTTTLAAVTMTAMALAACSTAGASDEAAGQTTTRPGAVTIGADDAVTLLEERDDLRVIDVRTPQEFDQGHLDGAELLDIYEAGFRDDVAGLDRDASYVLYCRSGNRSSQAAALMEDLGFAEVYDAGGLATLAEAGATVVR
ncbi:MAG: rhodanese-like domain-containing protein [Nitriliruptoraceae bacterium]